MIGFLRRISLCMMVVGSLYFSFANAAETDAISEIRVFGNRAVQTDAVRGLMMTRVGMHLDALQIRSDILSIYKSGYFQNVVIEKMVEDGKVILLVHVDEKASIKEIKFQGFESVESSTLTDKLTVKKYTIIDEKKISADVKMIEQSYVEKGFYLARASYSLDSTDSGEVDLTYKVVENSPVGIRHVNTLGNVHFGDAELKAGMMTSETRWTSWLMHGGLFKDEFVNRDKEYLAYIYRDNGFAEASVSTPQSRLDGSRELVDVSFFIEEGQRFKIRNVKFSGDVIFPEAILHEKMLLKEDKWFRISQFQTDIRTITDLYGDEGYAFVDTVPKTSLHRDLRVMDIEYVITKGEKAYFRNIVVEGNSKTRDNVVRRNMKVAEGERFQSTKLDKSKNAIERLGFFKETLIQREPDEKNAAMDLRVKVKENQTGSVNASIGVSPSVEDTKQISYTAQGSYSEANLLGKGWNSNIKLNITQNPSVSEPSWGAETSLTEPSINDGPWSVTGFLSWNYDVSKLAEDNTTRYTRRRKTGFSIGREIIEDLRLSLGYSYEQVNTNDISPIFSPFTEHGDTERLTQSLSYDRTNNFLQPTSGFYLGMSNTLATRLLGGEYHFGKAEASVVLYVPIDFSDDFRTNFRIAFEPGFLYATSNRQAPMWERFRLGSALDMKGYLGTTDIGPHRESLRSPSDSEQASFDRALGGNRRIFGAIEYFVPLIPEANLRLVSFGEAGNVLEETESFQAKDLHYDVGMGLRWLTPIAHFRFEWAWPVKNGRLGDSQFVFFIGNDSQSRF